MSRITTFLCVSTMVLAAGSAQQALAADTGANAVSQAYGASPQGAGSYYNSSGYGGFGNNAASTAGNATPSNSNGAGAYGGSGYRSIYGSRSYGPLAYPGAGDSRYYRDLDGYTRGRLDHSPRKFNGVTHRRNDHEPRTRHFIHGEDMAY
ncbi:hypothetical protein [Allorhodopirellula solitaria]|uniref:Uncharacterized protein n=1 Tax=Allorhodopirellula solitaria TaxID=2527987 RepID=A0A5C5YG13_9BACT|nr:hypothetical protein [Allorhodopirellula solitaria]TWT74280.1 hypothetical protein CA85_11670 [Allorhodopirellula solitaria]